MAPRAIMVNGKILNYIDISVFVVTKNDSFHLLSYSSSGKKLKKTSQYFITLVNNRTRASIDSGEHN